MMKILERIEKRDVAFNKQTKKIVECLKPNVLPAIYLILKEFGDDDVNYFRISEVGSGEDQTLVIYATVEYPIGLEFLFEGTMISITEENQSLFRKFIRISVPSKFVDDETTVEEIYQYLHSRMVVGRPSDIFPDEEDQNNIEDIDFNLNNLSDEHKETLKMFEHTNQKGTKKN